MAKINVTRSSMPTMEEYIKEIEGVWESRWLTNAGVKHQELIEQLKQYFGVSEVSLYTNGHQALEAVFSIFPKGSEVITTPFTYASTTLAILRNGLIPKFCDIEPVYYTIDVTQIEALITDKTVAIAPVHVYGNLCDWREIERIAKKHDLKVIYDAAHAFGVYDGERGSATLGDVSMFSFHATKVFHTIEGGCLAHNDSERTKTFNAWCQFGMYDRENVELMGTNAKMSEFQAAMGLCNLRHLEEQIALRKRAAMRYRELLGGKQGIVLCPEQSGVKHNYAYFPVRFCPELCGFNRDQVMERLAKHDIGARKYFYPLTSQFPICKDLDVSSMPVAEQVTEEILCLPLYAGLENHEVEEICEVILRGE